MLWQVDDLRCGVWYAMDKEQILSEIRRTAEANGGLPLGMGTFQAETGIRQSDWRGKYWARWGDALQEAGFAANRFGIAPYEEDQLLDKYAQYARELGRLPTQDDLRLKARKDSTFPSATTFRNRWTKTVLVVKLLEFCRNHREYVDVAQLCCDYAALQRETSEEVAPADKYIGFVYLLKSGRFYKIGKTNAAGRREYELSIQLPEPVKTVHLIRTDDPAGIEAYWHKRFAEKRKNGEWFELDATDVAAFKRRKFM